MSLNSTLKTLSLASLLALSGFAFTPAALAGDCPAGQTAADAMKPGATMPKDVTDNVIGSIDLGNGYNIAGKTMRMRKLVVQPGGIVPWHSHNERPAMIYIVSGEVVEYASSCAVPIVHKAGDIAPEKAGTSHWWKNTTRKPVVLLSADILHDKADHKSM